MKLHYDKRTGELWNSTRADDTIPALDAFCDESYGRRSFATLISHGTDVDSDAYTAVQDLINNLLHLADRYGWPIVDILEAAKASHDYEVEIERTAGDDEPRKEEPQ